MKKTIIILSAVAFCATVACQKESAGVLENDNILTFTASYPQTEEAKTVLNSDKEHVSWTASESFSVHCTGVEKTGAEFVNSAAALSTFTGVAPAADNYYALSPSSALVGWKPSESDYYPYGVMFMIPNQQTATKGSWDPAASILYGTADGTSKAFTFNHVTGYLKFTIGASSGSIKSVEVSAAVGLAGQIAITDLTKIKGNKESGNVEYKSITLATADGSAMEQGDYYVALRARTYSAGFTLTFTNTENKTATAKVPGGKVVENGVVYNLGTVSGLNFDPVVTTVIGDPYQKGDVKGVIFWVDPNNAKNVKIVSLKANGPMNFCTNAEAGGSTVNALSIPGTSATDGAANMTAIAKFMSDNSIAESEMLGYATCKAEGDGWYLPSTGELADLVLGYSLGLDFTTIEATRATSGDKPSEWESKLTAAGADATLIAIYKGAYEARVKMDKSLTDMSGDPINAVAESNSKIADGTTYLSSTQDSNAAKVGYACSGGRPRTSTAAKYAQGPTRYIRCIKAVTLD